MSKRDDLVTQANALIGTVAGSWTHTALIDDYNSIRPLPQGYSLKYSDPWCAAFVSVCAMRADLLDIIPAECSCPRMINLFKQMGCWVEDDSYIPNPGDIIFYDWQDSGVGDNTGDSDHVGIVEAANADSIGTIEGNVSSMVARKLISTNGLYIRGFGVPAYNDGISSTPVVSEVETVHTEPVAATSKTYTAKSGDSPWSIAQTVWGDGSRYQELYTINGWDKSHVIHPGDVILTSVQTTSSNGSTEQELKDYLESQVNMLGGRVIWSD